MLAKRASPTRGVAIVLAALACLSPGAGGAQPAPANYPRSYGRLIQAGNREGVLVIYAATDIMSAKDVLDAFRASYPAIRIEYADLGSSEVYQRFLREAASGRTRADLLINSAMDLQIKLVNDGYAQRYGSPEKPNLPPWAIWKDQAYAIAAEPIVIAYNRRLLSPAEAPRTHDDLEALLKKNPQRYHGRIGVYDPGRSSTGFLYMTQDVQIDRDTWRVIDAIGKTSPFLSISTTEMINKIAKGELAIAYNVIGSYALDQEAKNPDFGVVLPGDYTLVASRIALIPKDAPHPAAAKLFLDFLLSQRGETLMARRHMTPLRADVRPVGQRVDPDKQRAIRVGPALLANLDQLKRGRFLKRWRRTVN